MTQWKTYSGRILHFHEMDNEHLANINHLLSYYQQGKPADLLAEIKKRKLSKKFLKNAPYTFQDKVTGRTMIFNYELNRVVECMPMMKVLKK